MSDGYLITREIGIDMGHRLPHHASKCRSLHGHRYTIEASCSGALCEDGEQQGMILDFGFLKDEMMAVIDVRCDHGMCLWHKDPWVGVLCAGHEAIIEDDMARQGYCSLSLAPDQENPGGKYYIVPFVPTAEHLARHWFEQLQDRVTARTQGRAQLHCVTVWETPHCAARYPATS